VTDKDSIVTDKREMVEKTELMEYSQFLDAWHLIEDALKTA
jgi:hypothetical protein